MIVSHSLRLLFAHVPKAGGSAVTATLLPWLDAYGRASRDVDAHGWQVGWHYRSAMHGPWKRDEPEARPLLMRGYRLIAVHRCPYERVASLWRRVGECVGGTLDRFLRKPHRRFAGHLKRATEVSDPKQTIWLPYENLESALQDVLREQGVEEPPSMTSSNVTPDQRPTDQVLTPFARDWIAEHFAPELEYFGN